MKPLLLDTYSCEGGASRGYWLAGFDVVGVDLFRYRDANGKVQGFSRSRYPYPSVQGDVIDVLTRLVAGELLEVGGMLLGLEAFDAIHASPPCQHASAGTRAMRSKGDDRHPALIEPTRELLEQTGLPYVIENVKGAALRDPVTLCWSMFHEASSISDNDGVPLRMERHRLFESNVPLSAPKPCHHPADVQVAGSYGAAQRTIAGAKKRRGGYVPSRDVQQRLLGIDWMTERGMHQSLPPAYTQHVGGQLLAHLALEAAA